MLISYAAFRSNYHTLTVAIVLHVLSVNATNEQIAQISPNSPHNRRRRPVSLLCAACLAGEVLFLRIMASSPRKTQRKSKKHGMEKTLEDQISAKNTGSFKLHDCCKKRRVCANSWSGGEIFVVTEFSRSDSLRALWLHTPIDSSAALPIFARTPHAGELCTTQENAMKVADPFLIIANYSLWVGENFLYFRVSN